MNILSIKDKKTTRLIIEYYYFIVFGVYFGSIFSPYIRTGVTMTFFLFFLFLNSRIQNIGNNRSFVLYIFAIYCLLSIIGYTYNDVSSVVPYFADISNQLLPMMFFFIPPGMIDKEKFFNMTALGIALSLIFGLYFLFTSPSYYVDFISRVAFEDYERTLGTVGLRFQSIYGSIITGTLCLYLIILSSYKIFYTKLTSKSLIVNLVYFVLGVSCAFMSQQRSAMAITFVLLLAPFSVYFFRAPKPKKLYTVIVVGGIVFICTYLVVVIPDYIDRYIYRLSEIESGLSGRDNQWKTAIENNPNLITGIGLGSSGHKAQGYYQYLVLDGGYWKILNEVGIVGFTIFILPIFGILLKHIRSFPKLYRCYMVVLCVMVQSVASNTICFMLTLPMFWFALRTINQEGQQCKA